MSKYEVISADGHIEGPFDWAKRMPSKYAEAAPKLVQRDDGAYAWRVDYAGVQAEMPIGAGLYCGLPYDQFGPKTARTYWNPDGSLRPGCGAEDPVQRLREQDADGIDAEVLYWPMGIHLVEGFKGKDADAYRAVIRMYTDFLAEYSSVAPDRLVCNHLLPSTGVEDAIAEIKHGREKGLKSVVLSKWPNGSGNPDPEVDDRFWAAALDLGVAVTVHEYLGDAVIPPHELGVSPLMAMGARINFGKPALTAPIAQLLYYGTFDRFPALKIYIAEAQGAWLAGWLDYVDEFYARWAPFHGTRMAKQPSEYVRDHLRFSFIHDRLAMPFRHYIGLDLLMWGSDFPHSVGTYPETKYVLDDLFENVPAAERKQVLVDNVCEFFHLDPDKELTPTPA